jgi:hypothetical protein
MAIAKYEKHRAFYEVRDALLKCVHCAFCFLESKAMHKYFDSLLYEKVNDPGLRDGLVRSQGFCPRHAHMLAGFGDGLGTALLYEDQIRLRLKTLVNIQAPRRKSRVLPSGPKDEAQCPACHSADQIRWRHIRTLIEGMQDPEMASALESSAGLCFPHLMIAVSATEDPEVREELIRMERKKMETLLAQLEKYVLKSDYGRTSEAFAEERDSWMRAVEFVSGLKNVF